MDNTATDEPQNGPPLGLSLHDQLGPLPERTLAEIHNPATGERELSETGTAYYGSNWRHARKLYTADDMHAYALRERKQIAEWIDCKLGGGSVLAAAVDAGQHWVKS